MFPIPCIFKRKKALPEVDCGEQSVNIHKPISKKATDEVARAALSAAFNGDMPEKSHGTLMQVRMLDGSWLEINYRILRAGK